MPKHFPRNVLSYQTHLLYMLGFQRLLCLYNTTWQLYPPDPAEHCVSYGARAPCALACRDLKSTPLTTRANWLLPPVDLQQHSMSLTLLFFQPHSLASRYPKRQGTSAGMLWVTKPSTYCACTAPAVPGSWTKLRPHMQCRSKGCSGNWAQDLSHPERESCH